MRSSPQGAAIILAIFALTLVPRLIGIDLFATVDEPYWLTAGSDFYYALSQRDFEQTVYDYHPAVTTMWVVTTAMLMYFPQYRGMGQGYFDVYKDSLEQFLLVHEHTPLELLMAARLVQVLVISLLLLLVYLLLQRLLDARTAVVAVLFLSFDPFFLGHSRLLNHEALMTELALVSLLSLLAYASLGRGVGWLILSGAAMGLAELTKSSASVLIPVAVALVFIPALFGRPSERRSGVRGALRDLGAWAITVAALYFLLWPGMWVAPGAMLREVFGNAMSYAVAGSRLAAVETGGAATAQHGLRDVVLYLQSIAWRTTPTTWVGLLLCAASLRGAEAHRRLVLLMLACAGGMFVLLFGLASGRNSAHYVMFAYAAADILAGAGFVWAAAWLATRMRPAWQAYGVAAVTTAAVVAQGLSGAAFFPYYYNYYNPVMELAETGRENPNFGYGEGLDLAAGYLESKPGAADTTAMAFYGRGPFSYFFSGRTEPLKPVYADAENVPQLVSLLERADYLVIYYAIQQGRNIPKNVMEALQGVAPEHTIWLNGIEYVRIYAMATMPEDFLERLGP